MAEPFDLDNNQPPDPVHRTGGGMRPQTPQPPLAGQLPTTRASDLLRSKSATGGPAGDPSGGPFMDADRRATPFDNAASGLLAICGVVFFVGVAYLLWGTWSGAFADPNWSKVYSHADRLRTFGNIALCGQIMGYLLWAATALFLFLFYHEDYSGYALLAGAVALQLGVPYLTGTIYNMQSHGATDATKVILQQFYNESWIIGVPGFLLTLFNIFKSVAAGLENARAKRSLLKFGQKAVKDVKHRNVFLGACWNMPFCKDGIRARCPIYVKKAGPCWRTKRGCMCDQTILLIAQAPNWKQNVSATVGKLNGRTDAPVMPELPPQPQLSREAKNERCRQCVIYNLHQEQKYKLVVALLLGGTIAAIAYYNQVLLTTTGNIFMYVNDLAGRFSITTNTSPIFPNGAPPFVEWLILGSVVLVTVSYLLHIAEWFCFKLKV